MEDGRDDYGVPLNVVNQQIVWVNYGFSRPGDATWSVHLGKLQQLFGGTIKQVLKPVSGIWIPFGYVTDNVVVVCLCFSCPDQLHAAGPLL